MNEQDDIRIEDEEFSQFKRDFARKAAKPYRDVIDVEYFADAFARGKEYQNEIVEGGSNIDAAAQFTRMMKKAGTPEEKKEVFKETLARLLAGERVFPGQPDPKDFSHATLEEQVVGHSEYLYALGECAQHYSRDLQERNGLDGLWLGYHSVKDIPDTVIAEAKNLAYAKLCEPKGFTRQMRLHLENWHQTGAELGENMTDVQRGMYLRRGAKLLQETAEAHFHREKPGFFARIFRTKAAREYAEERILLNEIGNELKRLDPEGNFRGNLDENTYDRLDYNNFLNKDAYLRHVGNTTMEALGEEMKEATYEDEQAFEKYDRECASINGRAAHLNPMAERDEEIPEREQFEADLDEEEPEAERENVPNAPNPQTNHEPDRAKQV